MHLVFVRHGQADYSDVDARRYIGHGRDLAKLTENGRQQAEAVSKDPRLEGAQLILSSPYTRALQTAAIIAKNTGIDIRVETDLHEWIPDLTFTYGARRYLDEIKPEIEQYKGEHCWECRYPWESFSALGERAFRVIRNYVQYDKLIVVTHGILMRQFVYRSEIPYCGILETQFDAHSVRTNYIESSWL
ncbi:MAG TPA: histidine phosphatase family protein [Oscillospiraceae bacterium]|nr:histidine phosphatase family protein [Oscillospiraceae bacterium]